MKNRPIINKITISTAFIIIFIISLYSFFNKSKEDIVKITNESSVTQLGTSSTQYIIISFDGSRSLDMWRDSVDFASEMKRAGHPVYFTYFINPIYLLTRERARTNYYPPKTHPGNSKIGYATSDSDINKRIEAMNLAYLNGHEIASHAVGHFNGRLWLEEDWQKEFNQFKNIIDSFDSEVGSSTTSHTVTSPLSASLKFNSNNIKGFRAPELGINSDLYKVLSKNNFSYDSSETALAGKFPKKDNLGIWHIGIGIVKINKERTGEGGVKTVGKYGPYHTIAMDYNFWMIQSLGKNVVKKGDVLWNDFFNEVKFSYIDYFNKSYNGNRAPIVIGHHFSKWNDGVYWEALKSFVKEVCVKPDVKCVTFEEYVKYLNGI